MQLGRTSHKQLYGWTLTAWTAHSMNYLLHTTGMKRKPFIVWKSSVPFAVLPPLLYIRDGHRLLYLALKLLATRLLHLSSHFLCPGQMESAVRIQRKAILRGIISCGYSPCYLTERSTNDGIEFIRERTSGSVTHSH